MAEDKTRISNPKWPALQEFMHENKQLLIMIADPRTDEVCFSFMGQNAFVRYPAEDMSKGVVFNALRESKFQGEAIDAFIFGVIQSTGIDVTNMGGNELLKLVGGVMMNSLTIKSERPHSKLEVINSKPKGTKQNGRRK